MTRTQSIWSSALAAIAKELKPEELATWFKDIEPGDITPNQAVIRTPSAFYSKWLEVYYAEKILSALEQVTGSRPELVFDVADKPSPSKPAEPEPRQPPRKAQPKPTSYTPQLNKDYTFNRFVTGPSNRLGHAAALATVESPGVAYNPLFLHGGVGLGKTHLMHAVAHALMKRHRNFHIRYFSCESFMNQFISALQKGGIEQFRARCRRVDALMIDDIHVLAERTRTQEEFFHTFNELYNAHKQIILSSDSPPEEIPTFEDRLVSRFKWGMVARIDPPCFETRMAIVQKKAEARGWTLPGDVVEYLANIAPSNVRELEGAVLKTIGYASLTGRPVTIATAREVLRADRPKIPRGVITPDGIEKVVGGAFGVTPEQLQSKSRARSVAFPRQVCMYLTRSLTNLSLQEVGRAFGGRDHSTVAHACEKIEKERTVDPEFRSTLNSLTQQVRAHAARSE